MLIEYIGGGVAAAAAAVLLIAWLLRSAGLFDEVDSYWGLVLLIVKWFALALCLLLFVAGVAAFTTGTFSLLATL